MSSPNVLICGDTEYTLTPAYKRGARAMRERIPYRCNPYRHGCQSHEDWNAGHENESAGEHIRFGRDLIEARNAGEWFDADPNVPMVDNQVDPNWYEFMLKRLAEPSPLLVRRPHP